VTPVNYAIYCKQYLKNRLISYKRELSRLGKFYSTGRLLEVGSGYGFFLEMASHAGWNAQGVEISNYACEVAKSRGCIVYNGDIKHAHFPMESFDVIVMWDVIEHFTSPAEIIQYCLSLLRPNGALVLKTPNALALSPSPFSPIRTIYRHFVYPANTAEHAFHFTPESLSAMICKRCIEHKNININTERGEWSERVIAGSSFLVRGIRWMIMKYAYIQRWPYEFVITSIKG
jgi:2-polyprenyl-3-methyl-5-hydroxy-6-metoxy-1,4-benzoquinol methylase